MGYNECRSKFNVYSCIERVDAFSLIIVFSNFNVMEDYHDVELETYL